MLLMEVRLRAVLSMRIWTDKTPVSHLFDKAPTCRDGRGTAAFDNVCACIRVFLFMHVDMHV